MKLRGVKNDKKLTKIGKRARIGCLRARVWHKDLQGLTNLIKKMTCLIFILWLRYKGSELDTPNGYIKKVGGNQPPTFNNKNKNKIIMTNTIIDNIDDKYKFLDVKDEIKRIITNHTDDNGVCELAKIHIYRYFNDNVLPNFNNKHKVDYLKNIEGIKDPNLDKDMILSRRKLDTILDELINEKFISMDDNNTIHLLVEKDFDTDKLIAEYTTDLINQLKLHKLRTSQKVNDENYSQILEEVTNKFLDRIAHLNFNYIDEKTINPVNVMADSVLTSLEDTYAKFIYDETKHDGNFALSKQHTDEAIEDIINIIRKNVKLMNDNIYLAVHLKVDIFKRLEHNFGTISVKQRPWIDMKIDMKISSLIRSLNKQNKEKNQLYYQEIYLKRTKEHTPNFYEKMMREEKLNKLIIKS